jgi:ATP-dependent helicase HrpA
VQDVRDRPMDKQTQADQAHAKFDDEKSEFSGYLKLWKWLGDSRGVQDPKASHGQARQAPGGPKASAFWRLGGQRSPLQLSKGLRTNSLTASMRTCCARTTSTSAACANGATSISQLHSVIGEQGWQLNDKPASYEQLHLVHALRPARQSGL